jgi:hypothetical protein
MGRYEVTNEEFAGFLNDVAAELTVDMEAGESKI